IHHKRETGEEYTEESHVGPAVHSTYETTRGERKAPLIKGGIKHALGHACPHLPHINSGKEAAAAIIALMERTAVLIPPTDLVDAFINAGGTENVGVQDALWDEFGERTIAVMT